MAKDFKARGISWLGSITIYAFLQQCGLQNDHCATCFRNPLSDCHEPPPATSTFGAADRATTTDFKSPAYHMPSQNLMMWHVANSASTARYKSDARYRYYTNNNFLSNVPGQKFPGIYAGARRTTLTSSNVCGRRLTTPIRWETNNARAFYDYELSPLVKSYHIRNAGENKMDFAVGCDGDCATCTFAVCPAISWTANGCGNTEHACIGGAITNSRFRSDVSMIGFPVRVAL